MKSTLVGMRLTIFKLKNRTRLFLSTLAGLLRSRGHQSAVINDPRVLACAGKTSNIRLKNLKNSCLIKGTNNFFCILFVNDQEISSYKTSFRSVLSSFWTWLKLTCKTYYSLSCSLFWFFFHAQQNSFNNCSFWE